MKLHSLSVSYEYKVQCIPMGNACKFFTGLVNCIYLISAVHTVLHAGVFSAVLFCALKLALMRKAR